MSPATDNFIHSLVEMSKAFEELPSVKSELDQAKAEADTLARSVQAREESIARLKAEIESLHARVRDTEAQRDDAELRFLESDERTHKALEFIKSSFGSAGSLIQALEPPAEVVPVKEEPKVEAEPIPVEQSPYYNAPKPIDNPMYDDPQVQDQSASHPTPAPVDPTTTGTESGVSSSEPQGQSAADPTVPTVSSESGGDATSNGAKPIESASQPTTTEQSSADDVGYHNEPSLYDSHWTQWDAWAERMNAKHGIGQWPTRPQQVSA